MTNLKTKSTAVPFPCRSKPKKIAVGIFLILPLFALVVSCTTGRWVQEGKSDEEIQRDQKECEEFISEEEGADLDPEQYTSTRYWEREPPMKSSPEDIMARGMLQCMKQKGYQFKRE